jgi:hypothetical protein
VEGSSSLLITLAGLRALFSTSLSCGSSIRISESPDAQSLFSWNWLFTIEGDLQTLLAKLILPPVLFS